MNLYKQTNHKVMHKIQKLLLAQVFFILGSTMLYAQDHPVHGMVHAFENIPINGAEIKVKSTKQIVKTDSLGKFFVVCNAKDKFTISANGFKNQNVSINKKIKVVAVNLQIKSGKKNIDHAIGYGHISEKNRSSATGSIQMKEDNYSRYNDIYDLLRGQFAGVEVKQGAIIIRGTTSYQLSNAALIVVDGVIVGYDILSTIRPIDVKSVHVIKDGSAAVYGSRGANGVLIIETRNGSDDIN